MPARAVPFLTFQRRAARVRARRWSSGRPCSTTARSSRSPTDPTTRPRWSSPSSSSLGSGCGAATARRCTSGTSPRRLAVGGLRVRRRAGAAADGPRDRWAGVHAARRLRLRPLRLGRGPLRRVLAARRPGGLSSAQIPADAPAAGRRPRRPRSVPGAAPDTTLPDPRHAQKGSTGSEGHEGGVVVGIGVGPGRQRIGEGPVVERLRRRSATARCHPGQAAVAPGDHLPAGSVLQRVVGPAEPEQVLRAGRPVPGRPGPVVVEVADPAAARGTATGAVRARTWSAIATGGR